MKFVPYAFQEETANYVCNWFDTAVSGDRLCIASPTGSGKSVMELVIQSRLTDCGIVTPRIEIIFGLLDKLGYDARQWSKAKITEVADSHKIYTPIRFRNRLMDGSIEPPSRLIWDEGHHQEAESWKVVELACGVVPQVMFTATPYRGTPKSTVEFRKKWGEPLWVMTYPEAVQLGVIHMPAVRTVPLLDDDLVTISNGQFVVSSMEKELSSRLEELVGVIANYWNGSVFTKPCAIAIPTKELAVNLSLLLTHCGIGNVVLTDETSYGDRLDYFDRCLACTHGIICIRAISEGVDLPLRLAIDAIPRISPVDFMQFFGRFTRPLRGGLSSEYVCCNRNILRHGYLLDGLIPPEQVLQAQSVFGPGERAGARVLGLEGLGRFKPINVELVNGTVATCYMISCTDGHVRTDYAAITVPTRLDVVWASKESTHGENGSQWGKWAACRAPTDVTGFATVKPSPLTPKQQAFWDRTAKRVGLKQDQKLTAREFQVMPVLDNLGVRLK